MSALYTTSATALAGRNGQVTTDDGLLDLALSYPKALGGTGTATNPEQLFAAGYSACFSNAILHVAQQQKLGLKAAPTKATVALKANEQGGFVLDVALDVTLDMEDAAAIELVRLHTKYAHIQTLYEAMSMLRLLQTVKLSKEF